MHIFVRVRHSDLFSPLPEVQPRTFELTGGESMADAFCAAGCMSPLKDGSVTPVPFNAHPEDHKFHGYGNATAVMVHTRCLTPQPPRVWREFLGAAHRLVSVSLTRPEKYMSAVHSMLAALEEARGPERLLEGQADSVTLMRRAASFARMRPDSSWRHVSAFLTEEADHHEDDRGAAPNCDAWSHAIGLTEAVLHEEEQRQS